MVIADTSVWIPFFNQPESLEKREIDALIDADGLVLVGVVLAELLQGCRTPKEADTILSKLRSSTVSTCSRSERRREAP